MLTTILTRRARLAAVSRAFRLFCGSHATCMRRRTELAVPFESWDVYSRGAARWVAWHAATLRAVHIGFEVCQRSSYRACLLHPETLCSPPVQMHKRNEVCPPAAALTCITSVLARFCV